MDEASHAAALAAGIVSFPSPNATDRLEAMRLTARYDANRHLLHVDRGALPEAALRDRLAALHGVEPGPGRIPT